MTSEWPIVTLQEVCETITDGAHASPKDYPGGLPMASVKDMARWGIDVKTSRTIAPNDFEDLVRNGCQPQIGDILIAKDGATCLDTVCEFKQPDKIVLLSSVAILRPSDRLHSSYLRYYLDSADTRAMLKAGYVSGSAIPRVVLKDFRRAPIPLPPLSEQKAIASILGALDDKIELNRRMNATLEGMARALFQSWFVDFDPIRAKLDGRKPEGMDKATAALFPDAFQESPIGPVPKGWTIRALADVIDVKHGFAFEGKYFSDERCGDILLTPGNFAIGGGFKDAKVKYYIGPVSEDYILCDHDLVLTMTDLSKAADTLGYPAMIPPPPMGYRYLHNQRIGKVHITQSNAATPLFLYRLFCSEAYRHEILAGATGTTVKHTSPTRIRAFKSLFPSAGVLEVFEKQLNIWYLLATQNESQSRTLATLRDTLLPKLLSGELSQ